MDETTLLEAVEGVERVVSVHVQLKSGTTPMDARVIAAKIASAVGTPVEVLYDIGGMTHSAMFNN